MRILLVDDDVFLRDIYATKFTERGDEVVGASDAQEALKLAREESFDAIVMDMVMPGITGTDLLKSLQEADITGKAKCIVLSNQSEETDIEEAKKHGAIGYIIKAESIPSEVVEEVHQLVS